MITKTELRFVKARGKLYPDVKETLARLLDHGHFLTLCMNAGEAYTEAVLNTCGIANLFDAVYFRRTSEDIKTEMATESTNRARHSRACCDRRSLSRSIGRQKGRIHGDRFFLRLRSTGGAKLAAGDSISFLADLLAFL